MSNNARIYHPSHRRSRSVLPEEKEKILLSKSADGDIEARNHLILHFMPLVERFARKLHNRESNIDDLRSEGVIALIHAIETYDPSFGTRLSTHAIPVIHERMRLHELRNGFVLKIPRSSREGMLIRHRERIMATNGRPGALETQRDIEMLAEAIGMTPKHTACVIAASATFGAAEGLLNDADVLKNAGIELPDTHDQLCERLFEEHLEAFVHEIAEEFDERRRVILLERIHPEGEPVTLGELAERFGVSRERIRQVETNILARIRRRAATMSPYLRKPEPVAPAAGRQGASIPLMTNDGRIYHKVASRRSRGVMRTFSQIVIGRKGTIARYETTPEGPHPGESFLRGYETAQNATNIDPEGFSLHRLGDRIVVLNMGRVRAQEDDERCARAWMDGYRLARRTIHPGAKRFHGRIRLHEEAEDARSDRT